MDSTILYRPTLEDQRFFDEIRRHIDRHRDEFSDAGRWLETKYAIKQVDRRERKGRPGDPANYQQAQEEMEERYRAAGVKTKRRSPGTVPFVRLIRCAQDILQDQPDVTNYERNERLPLARRIIFVTWLMTDPDAAELKLGFTTLETMPWGGDWRVDLLGRSMVRDEIIPRGWMELARPAWYELGGGDKPIIDGPASPKREMTTEHHDVDPRVAELAGLKLKPLFAIVNRARAQATEPQRESHREPDPVAGRLSVSDLAKSYGLTPKEADALRKRFDRWRPSHCNGEWIETEPSYRRPRDPKYLYDPKAVEPIIEDLKKRRAVTSA